MAKRIFTERGSYQGGQYTPLRDKPHAVPTHPAVAMQDRLAAGEVVPVLYRVRIGCRIADVLADFPMVVRFSDGRCERVDWRQVEPASDADAAAMIALLHERKAAVDDGAVQPHDAEKGAA